MTTERNETTLAVYFRFDKTRSFELQSVSSESQRIEIEILFSRMNFFTRLRFFFFLSFFTRISLKHRYYSNAYLIYPTLGTV